eukprot:g36355.t1
MLLDCCGLQAANIYCLQDFPSGGYFDVTFKSVKQCEHLLKILEEKGGEGPLSIQNAVPLFVQPAQRSRIVTICKCNPRVPAADVLTFLGRYVQVESDSSDMMDSFRIWTSKTLKAEAGGNILHPPSSFVIGGSQGYLTYAGQPRVCRTCGRSGHMVAECKVTPASKIIFWSRVCSVEQDETCLHPFFQKVHKESSELSSLKEEDGSVTSSQSDIHRISKSFYARLNDMMPPDSTASQSFLSSIIDVLDDSTGETSRYLWTSRKIADSLALLGDMIAYMQGRGVDACLISLDQKAFNRILHMYMRDVLSKMGFGEGICNWIRLNQSQSTVSRFLSICDQFELASGAKVNRGKSEAMVFGNRATQSFIPFTIRADYLKVLSNGFRGAGACAKTCEECATKVGQKLSRWEHWSLSIVGKNLVI